MNEQNKYRTLWVAILSLLILNLAILGWMMFSKNIKLPPPHPPTSPTAISRDLGFDDAQNEVFRKMIEKHFEEIEPIRDSIRILKSQAFEFLKGEDFDKAAMEAKIVLLSKKIMENELKTRLHFREIRNLCTPKQKEIFDTEILEKFKRREQNQAELHRKGNFQPK